VSGEGIHSRSRGWNSRGRKTRSCSSGQSFHAAASLLSSFCVPVLLLLLSCPNRKRVADPMDIGCCSKPAHFLLHCVPKAKRRDSNRLVQKSSSSKAGCARTIFCAQHALRSPAHLQPVLEIKKKKIEFVSSKVWECSGYHVVKERSSRRYRCWSR